MYLKEIKEMINLMNENNLNELEIERDGLRIRLKKGLAGGYEQVVDRTITSAAEKVPSLPGTEPIPQPATKEIEIKAPMVGTFYRAPSPDSPPYVEVGEEIEVGQVVCIIEAMKLMNEIKSEVKGKVRKVLVENGAPIEFGHPLFLIEPT